MSDQIDFSIPFPPMVPPALFPPIVAEGDVPPIVAEGEVEDVPPIVAEGEVEADVGAADGEDEEGDEEEEEGDDEEDSDENGGGSDGEVAAEFGGWAEPRGRKKGSKKKNNRGRKTHKCSAPDCDKWFSFGTTVGRRAFYTHVVENHGKDSYICSTIPCLQVSPTKKSAETHRSSTKRKHGRAFHPSDLLEKKKNK